MSGHVIRLLATDLDGTIISARDEFDTYDAFRGKLDELRARYGMQWVISTGRSIRSFHDVFAPLRAAGIVPDYVIVRHAFTYGVRGRRYSPHRIWNIEMKLLATRDAIRCRKLISHCRHELVRRFRRVKTLAWRKDRLCLRFVGSEALEAAAEMARTIAREHKNLQVFEHLTHLDVRVVPHSKGLAVFELARHLQVPKENILTIGDSYNDISMLDGAFANLCGCPANASPKIMEVVHHSRGHIAGKTALAGTLETIIAFDEGRVNSELPPGWEQASMEELSRLPDVFKHHSDGRPSASERIRGYVLVGLSALAVLVVLGHYRLLGPLSPVFSAPFELIVRFLGYMSQVIF